MNILLLDDDKYILEDLSHGIEWDKLPFDGRFEAKNVRQAKNVIEKAEIHVILCDIEMPGENGLDLLEWIREKNYPIEVVFLTSHPDFAYAQRAVSLGGFDYILKPVEYTKLTDVLLRAARKCEDNMIRMQYLSYGNTEEKLIREKKTQLFRRLVAGYNTTGENLLKDIREAGLDYTEEDQFVLYAVNVRNVEELNWRDDGQVYYILESTISEGLKKHAENARVITLETIWKENINLWVAAMKVDKAEDNIWYILGKTLSDTRKSFKWRHEFSAYISEIADMKGLHRQWVAIRKMIFDNIAFKEGIFFVTNFDVTRGEEEVIPFDREKVEQAFFEDDEEALSRLVNSFILELGSKGRVSSRVIQKSVLDWQQAVFRFLEDNQVLAETLYANDEYISLYQKIEDSLEDFRIFLQYITREALLKIRKLKESEDTLTIIKRYIDENLSGDLSRTTLANLVFLNPDYVSSFFRKETGTSIKQYVLSKRMNYAKELLQTTQEPIYSIAMKVGYPASSYFTRLFRSYFNKEPSDFRRKSSREAASNRDENEP